MCWSFFLQLNLFFYFLQWTSYEKFSDNSVSWISPLLRLKSLKKLTLNNFDDQSIQCSAPYDRENANLTYHHQRTIYSKRATNWVNQSYMTLDLHYTIKIFDIFVVGIPQIAAVKIPISLWWRSPLHQFITRVF